MDKASSYGCRDPGLRFRTGALNATNGHVGTFLRRNCVAFRLGTFGLVLFILRSKGHSSDVETPRSQGWRGKKNKNKKYTAFPISGQARSQRKRSLTLTGLVP